MNINLIKHNDTFLFPEGSIEKNYNFLLKVKEINEEIAFKCILGYERYFFALDDNIKLLGYKQESILNKYDIKMKRSEDDLRIEGGRCLELMIKDDITNKEIDITSGFMSFKNNLILLYAIEEESNIFINDKEHHLKANDYILIENFEQETIDVICTKPLLVADLTLASTEPIL